MQVAAVRRFGAELRSRRFSPHKPADVGRPRRYSGAYSAGYPISIVIEASQLRPTREQAFEFFLPFI